MVASASVETQLTACETAMIVRFGARSARTPPSSEKTTVGARNESMTQASFTAEPVIA